MYMLYISYWCTFGIVCMSYLMCLENMLLCMCMYYVVLYARYRCIMLCCMPVVGVCIMLCTGCRHMYYIVYMGCRCM